MNTTKVIAIIELSDDFKAIFVDTTPIVNDNPEIDSLDLENWAVKKFATGAEIVNIFHCDNETEAKQLAKTYVA